MSPRTSAITHHEVLTRAEHASAFLAAANLVRQSRLDVGLGPTTNVIGSLAVLAGIAASDAICGLALGKRAEGDAHSGAIKSLITALGLPGAPDLPLIGLGPDSWDELNVASVADEADIAPDLLFTSPPQDGCSSLSPQIWAYISWFVLSRLELGYVKRRRRTHSLS